MSLEDTLEKLDGTHPSLDDQALIEGLKVDLEVLSKNTAPKSPSKLPKIKPDQGKGSWQVKYRQIFLYTFHCIKIPPTVTSGF